MPSLHVRIQAKGGSQIDLTGIVDSGASGTVLARTYAEKLGLAPVDLREAGTIVVADGNKVRCWTTDTPIRAQVLRPAISDDDPQPWGPVFAIKPVFLEHATPLWGQTDFFATFEVTFWRNASPATFRLSH
jgi:Aspartyl protease